MENVPISGVMKQNELKRKKGQNAQMIHHFKPIFEQMRI